MKSQEFYTFNLEINPKQCAALSADLLSNYTEVTKHLNRLEKIDVESSSGAQELKEQRIKDNYNAKEEAERNADQIKAFINSVNHIREAKIVADKSSESLYEQAKNLGANTSSPDNIYGKEQLLKNEETREQVIKAYNNDSEQDSKRINKVILNIGNNKIVINDLASEIARVVPTQGNTMNNISYFNNCCGVEISSTQENYLHTRWNQASILGIGGVCMLKSFPNGTVKIQDKNNPNILVLNCNEKKELFSIEYITHPLANENHNNPGASGTITVKADVSNMIGKKESLKSPELPQLDAKSVSISYSSTNLPCFINSEVVDKIKKHASFERKPLLNFYYKVSNTLADYTYRPLINSINKYFLSPETKEKITPSKRESFKKTSTSSLSNKRDSFLDPRNGAFNIFKGTRSPSKNTKSR